MFNIRTYEKKITLYDTDSTLSFFFSVMEVMPVIFRRTIIIGCFYHLVFDFELASDGDEMFQMLTNYAKNSDIFRL